MIKTKIKAIVGLFALFTVLFGNTGIAYAVSPSVSESSRLFESGSSLIVLEDSDGHLWGLYLLGPVLYGIFYAPAPESLLWPALDFIFGTEMVRWVDGPGSLVLRKQIYPR